MENTMTEKDSLELISKMINTAKSQIDRASSFYYLFWGYLVVAASLLHYSLCKFFDLWKYAPLAWLLMLVGAAFNIPFYIKINKNRKVKTYTGRIVGNLWFAYVISICLLFFAPKGFELYFTPVILAFVAYSIFVTGIAFKFRPLIVGAIICWICTIISFRLQNIEQLLVNAFAITAGYIIPGHIINKQKDV